MYLEMYLYSYPPSGLRVCLHLLLYAQGRMRLYLCVCLGLLRRETSDLTNGWREPRAHLERWPSLRAGYRGGSMRSSAQPRTLTKLLPSLVAATAF